MIQILQAWEASQQDGESAARNTLLSTSSCLDGAAPRDCTAKMEGTPPPPPQQQREKEKPMEGEDGSEPPPTLKLPRPNPFIPSEFHIKDATTAASLSAPASDEKAAAAAENGERGHLLNNKHSPRKVVRDNAGRAASGAVVMLTLWHLQDRTFRQPRAEIYLKVTSLMLMWTYCMRWDGMGVGFGEILNLCSRIEIGFDVRAPL